MAGSDDSTLTKIAIFGITISLFCTLGVSIMFVETGDYSYDEIQAYRNNLIDFSGEGMLNDSPWVLTHVYTPWEPYTTTTDEDNNVITVPSEVKVDADGWLYGEEIADYTGLMTSADIRLDPNKKSSTPLAYEENVATYEEKDNLQWWTQIPLVGAFLHVGAVGLGIDPYNYKTVNASGWTFTGLRYTFDPTLPFQDETTASTVDGSLNIVWYDFNNTEGLAGGLQIYGGSVLLASYTASDIILDYDTVNNYATVYDFDFEGTSLHLSIRFDPSVIDNGTPLMTAWSNGNWSMAISSVSAGNFLDVSGSAAYTNSVGNLLETFIQIFTFSVPDLNNEWAGMILWLLCGLPMTIALLCVTLRVMQALHFL